MSSLSRKKPGASQAYEFTLVLSGVAKLSQDVLDGLFEAGCDDALIGMRDGVAFADFNREGPSFEAAIQSAIQNVEKAGVFTLICPEAMRLPSR